MNKYSVLGECVSIIKAGYRKNKWHKKHPESDTIPMNSFDFTRVSVGKGTYGELNVVDFGGNSRLILQNFISIAQNVTFILNAEHRTDLVSTYPFKAKILKAQNAESFGKGDIIVESDVWIGYGSTVLSGVRIGQGSIIAAGSVVCKDVEPYSVVGGTPAKLIKYRYQEDVRDYLLGLDYLSLSEETIKNHIDDLYDPIGNYNLGELEEKYFWFPKRKR